MTVVPQSREARDVPSPSIPHQLRARYVNTDPVHAVKSIPAGGHNTACLIWLNSTDAHLWFPNGSEITCTKCIRIIGN